MITTISTSLSDFKISHLVYYFFNANSSPSPILDTRRVFLNVIRHGPIVPALHFLSWIPSYPPSSVCLLQGALLNVDNSRLFPLSLIATPGWSSYERKKQTLSTFSLLLSIQTFRLGHDLRILNQSPILDKPLV